MPGITSTTLGAAGQSTGSILVIDSNVTGAGASSTTAPYIQWAISDATWTSWNNSYTSARERAHVAVLADNERRTREIARSEESRRFRAEQNAREERIRQEARAAAELRARQQQELNRRIQEEEARAEDRAKQLLYTFLSHQEIATYEQHGYIDVMAKDGSGKYRIRKGWAGNIERLGENDRPVERLCVHPEGEKLPDHDNMFLQRFLLMNDPDKLLPLANRTPLRS